jgi:hypothetical protein
VANVRTDVDDDVIDWARSGAHLAVALGIVSRSPLA